MGPVPVTVLTGFLGSGKTTLLNTILTGAHGVRIGVLVNEFGDVGIDGALVARRDEDVIELTNGCVCCTVRDDLLQAVATLLDRPRPPEHIVIETTGLADPVPVAQQLLDPRVQREIRLDAIITMVDAANFDRNLDRAEQAYSQIAHGDLLLINKTDLAAPEIIERITQGLRTLNPRARVLQCAHAQVDLRPVLGAGLFDPSALHTATAEHRHDSVDRFRAESFRSTVPIDLRRFADAMDHGVPAEVFRGKGILLVAGAPVRVIFHLVGERWTVTAGEPWEPGEERMTELVFIGRDLSAAAWQELEGRVRGCLVEQTA